MGGTGRTIPTTIITTKRSDPTKRQNPGIKMFLTALLLCLLPWAFAQVAYDPDDNSRPNNITGLYYPIYGSTGS